MSEVFEPLMPADIEWRGDVPFSRVYQDVYFSRENGPEESRHVFIDANGLIARWQALSGSRQPIFVIAETGFGSGLNFLLTWFLWRQHAPAGAKLHYISCEKHPLRKTDLCKVLANWPQFADQALQLLAQWPALLPGSYTLDFSLDGVQLLLLLGEAETTFNALLPSGNAQEESVLPTPAVDAWFLDGFAPLRNRSMWTDGLFDIMALMSRPGTTAATFSVAKAVREGLQRVGFAVEKKPGYGRKRHMLTACFQDKDRHDSIRQGHTAWHYPYLPRTLAKKAIVLGAGLAGACMARQLALRDWQVTVVDKASEPGQGASGNKKVVLFPYFSAYDSPMSRLLHQAWHFSINFYAHHSKTFQACDFQGVIQFADNNKRLQALKSFLVNQPELVTFENASALSALAGVPIKVSGLYYRGAGWFDAPAFCSHLLAHPHISWQGNQNIDTIFYDEGQWHVGDQSAPALIICAGYDSSFFPQTQELPLKAIRGQMSWVRASAKSLPLRTPLCGEGHILPATEDWHAFGASYDKQNTQAFCRNEDDAENLKKIAGLPVDLALPDTIEHSWSGVRAVTPDYLPLVGPVVDETAFDKAFGGLRKNARAFIPFADTRYPGLYTCAGFGSRGAVSIPYCTQWLAGVINAEPSILSRELQQALSPARFMCRKIKSSP